MNQTPNYKLNQWEVDDRVQRADFNADNAKIDAAIKAVDAKTDTKADASALSALAQTVASKGNCQIVIGSYVGTGECGRDHPNTLTFTQKPLIIFLATNIYSNYNSAQEYHILTPNLPRMTGHRTHESNILTWTEHSVSWYSQAFTNSPIYQYNELGTTYEYIALVIE